MAIDDELHDPVYRELRQLAAAKMANERGDHTLSATALVHEAWLRLSGEQVFESKSHYLRAASKAMRRILVDHARAKRADKRGGDWKRVDDQNLSVRGEDFDLLSLDEALAAFIEIHPQAAELVQLRYFAGLTNLQAAEALDVSPRTADRLWSYARAWLFQRISEEKLA